MHKDTKTPTNVPLKRQDKEKQKIDMYINQKYGQKDAKVLKLRSTPKAHTRSQVGRNSPTKE